MINFYDYHTGVLDRYPYMKEFVKTCKVQKWDSNIISYLDSYLPIIKKRPYLAYKYASTINGRWLEGESCIKKDLDYAYYYARDIIKGRWEEVEPYIMKDALTAYYYATRIIKSRWLEAEPVIAMNWVYTDLYNKEFGTRI